MPGTFATSLRRLSLSRYTGLAVCSRTHRLTTRSKRPLSLRSVPFVTEYFLLRTHTGHDFMGAGSVAMFPVTLLHFPYDASALSVRGRPSGEKRLNN